MIGAIGTCSLVFLTAWVGMSGPIWAWQTIKRVMEDIADES